MDEAITYAVNDSNVKVSTPDYALVFNICPDGPARFYLMDDDVPIQDIIPIEVIESLALADRDLDGVILTALHRATGSRNYDFITELERVRARFSPSS